MISDRLDRFYMQVVSTPVLLVWRWLFVRHRRCLLMLLHVIVHVHGPGESNPERWSLELQMEWRCSGSCTDRSETCLRKGKSFHTITITITWPAACANKPTARHKHTHVHPSLRVSEYLSVWVSLYLGISASYMAQQVACLPTDLQTIHRAFEIDPMAHLRLATLTMHLAQSAYGIRVWHQ